MVKKYNTALQSTGKVLDPVVNNIWVKATKAIKQKNIPLCKSISKSRLEFFFVMFSNVIGFTNGCGHKPQCRAFVVCFKLKDTNCLTFLCKISCDSPDQ